jgi:hypothetical protein
MDRVKELWQHWEDRWVGSVDANPSSTQPEFIPLFVSEPVDISQQGNGGLAPTGLKWYNIHHGAKAVAAASLAIGSPVSTILHCANCHREYNPCHSGGFCDYASQVEEGLNSAAGMCICRPGFEGSLCESSGFGCHEGAYGGCFHAGTCSNDFLCDCPSWQRNGKAFPIRGDACEYLPNCWDFETDGKVLFFLLLWHYSTGCEYLT